MKSARGFAKHHLDKDNEVWVSVFDFEEKCGQNMALLDFFLEELARDKSPEETSKM